MRDFPAMVKGEGIELTALENAHLETWRRWVNDPEVAALLDRVLPVTQAEHEAFFTSNVVENRSAVWFAMLHRGAYIGNVWLWNIDQRHRRAEVRILIGDRSAWGGGLGTEAIRLMTSFAHATLGLHKVYAYVMARNPRARAAFEKCGYVVEAELKEEAHWDGHYEGVWRLAHISAAVPR